MSLGGDLTASQVPEFSAGALTAPEDQVNPGLATIAGVAELLLLAPNQLFPR